LRDGRHVLCTLRRTQQREATGSTPLLRPFFGLIYILPPIAARIFSSLSMEST